MVHLSQPPEHGDGTTSEPDDTALWYDGLTSELTLQAGQRAGHHTKGSYPPAHDVKYQTMFIL